MAAHNTKVALLRCHISPSGTFTATPEKVNPRTRHKPGDPALYATTGWQPFVSPATADPTTAELPNPDKAIRIRMSYHPISLTGRHLTLDRLVVQAKR
jgi:hypothetical protein